MVVAFVSVWLVCAAVRLVLVALGAVHPQIWCNTIAHMDSIASGGLLAVVASKRPFVLQPWVRVVLLGCGVGVFALAARFGDFVGARSLITYPTVALAACAVIAASLHPKVVPSQRTILKPLLYLGKISYGLYVFHLMFVMLLGVAAAHTPGRRASLICAAFLCTVMAALASYFFLERPFLALKERFTHVPSRPVGFTADLDEKS
jgi:peptidoglycan/LPS O-acetylase OafA/YrhL